MKAFQWTAEEWWGNCLVMRQLQEVSLINTPDPQPYLDDQQTDKTFPALKEEVTPEAGNKYIQASIMIPFNNTFACRTVLSHKRNAEGNIIGNAHDNPILDSQVYEIEFSDGKVTALTVNAIAKAMYAQCDPEGNKYILLDKSLMSNALMMP